MATFTKPIVKFFIILSSVLCMPCPSFSAALTVSIKTTPDQAVLPLEVGFETTVTGGASPYSVTWNFGDGPQCHGRGGRDIDIVDARGREDRRLQYNNDTG